MIIDGNTYYKIANGLVANDGITLPSEYQRVEYIESSGTQYIDTGVAVTSGYNNTIAIVDFSISSLSIVGIGNYNSLFGINSSLQLGWLSDGKFTDGSSYSNTTFSINNRYTYKGDYNNGKSYIDDVYQITRTLSGSGNIYLFMSKDSSTTRFLSNGKIFLSKIYQNDVLVRNFIPCYRKSDSEIGMYDVVNGVFYTNQGSGTFLKGNDIKPYHNIKAVPYDAEIEYLESDGTQYIDTLIIPNTNTKMTCDLEITNQTMSRFGVIDTDTNRFHFAFWDTNNKTYGYLGISSTGMQAVGNTDNLRHTIMLDSTGKIGYDSTIYNKSYQGQIPNLSIWLFGRNSDKSSYRETGKYKVYSTKIEKDNSLILDLIPVRKGNVGYMYDKVSGKLFGNSGTGNFILGPDKEETPYISGHVTDGSSTFTFKVTGSEIVSTNIDSNGNWKWYVVTNVTNLSDSFKLKSALTKIYSNYNFKNCTTLYGAFTDAQTLQEIIFPKATFENVTSFAYMLNRAYALKRLIMPNATFINITQSSNMFINASNLEDIEIKSFINSINFSWQSKLTKQSVLNIINAAAANVTYTLHSTVYNKCASGGEWYSDIQAAIDAKAQQGYTVTLISA